MLSEQLATTATTPPQARKRKLDTTDTTPTLKLDSQETSPPPLCYSPHVSDRGRESTADSTPVRTPTTTHSTVFVLFEMEGVSGEQIARIVDCPVATVWRRLHYARQAFREALEAGGST